MKTPPKKFLKFTHEYAQAIVRGERLQTVRIGDKGFVVGDKVLLVDKVDPIEPASWLVLGELAIMSKYSFRLDQVPEELFSVVEESISNSEELKLFLERFYKDVSVDSIVVVLGFSFQAYSTPRPFGDVQPKRDVVFSSAVLYADGGSRGNPGPSAAGYFVCSVNNEPIRRWNKYLGITTNNQAEYHGLIAGLEWCHENHITNLQVRLDSLLVVNQMKGVFRVKNRDLWALFEYAKKLTGFFETITFTHVPRELNKEADAEVNKALDAIKDQDVVQ